MEDTKEDKVYSSENLPDDLEIFNKQPEFDLLDAGEIYQVEILKAQLKENQFYKPQETDPMKQGSKYQFNFEFVIIQMSKTVYGRRLWDTTSTAIKPETRRGPTKLYKIVAAALGKQLTWEDCEKLAPNPVAFVKFLETQIVGKQVKVAIENVPSKTTGKMRSKITSYSPVKKLLDPWDLNKKNELKDEEPKEEEKDPNGDIPF